MDVDHAFLQMLLNNSSSSSFLAFALAGFYFWFFLEIFFFFFRFVIFQINALPMEKNWYLILKISSSFSTTKGSFGDGNYRF